MAFRSTYTWHKQLITDHPQLLDLAPNLELPLRRTDRRYRRRCTTCCRFLARKVTGSYCSPCNSARRRNARILMEARSRATRCANSSESTWALLATLLS